MLALGIQSSEICRIQMRASTATERLYRPKGLEICVLLVLLAVGVQALHVHIGHEPAGSICLACVSARTGVPIPAVLDLMVLVAMSAALILGQTDVPIFEAGLHLFIRPPPTC